MSAAVRFHRPSTGGSSDGLGPDGVTAAEKRTVRLAFDATSVAEEAGSVFATEKVGPPWWFMDAAVACLPPVPPAPVLEPSDPLPVVPLPCPTR